MFSSTFHVIWSVCSSTTIYFKAEEIVDEYEKNKNGFDQTKIFYDPKKSFEENEE